jgi:hypothetical protein
MTLQRDFMRVSDHDILNFSQLLVPLLSFSPGFKDIEAFGEQIRGFLILFFMFEYFTCNMEM